MFNAIQNLFGSKSAASVVSGTDTSVSGSKKKVREPERVSYQDDGKICQKGGKTYVKYQGEFIDIQSDEDTENGKNVSEVEAISRAIGHN